MGNFKAYSKTFSSITDGQKTSQVIQVNKNFTIEQIALAGNGSSTFLDTIYIGLKVEDTDYFSPDLIPASAFYMESGSVYTLPAPLTVEAKKTLEIKLQNSKGSTLDTFVVILLGEEN